MATAAPPAPTGPAHVAVVSFLAARAAPTGGFWIALAGGVALARVAERRGARLGFGASIAAMLETVAIIGPARVGIPLTQAVSAPMLGRLEARGVAAWLQVLACAAVRLLHNTVTTAFFIWVIAGGLDAYAGTYDALGRRLGLEVGTADALALTAGRAARPGRPSRASCRCSSTAAGCAAGTSSRSGGAAAGECDVDRVIGGNVAHRPVEPGRWNPWLVTVTAVVAFAAAPGQHRLGSCSQRWRPGLGAGLARCAPTDREPVATGLVFAAILAGGALVFGLGGGLGARGGAAARVAARRCSCWWPPGCGPPPGRRACARCSTAVLARLRRVPAMPEATRVLDRIDSERRLAAAARSVVDDVSGVAAAARCRSSTPLLGWVVARVPTPGRALRAAGCRRARRAAAARAASGRATGAPGSRGRRTRARPTARRRGRRLPRACG